MNYLVSKIAEEEYGQVYELMKQITESWEPKTTILTLEKEGFCSFLSAEGNNQNLLLALRQDGIIVGFILAREITTFSFSDMIKRTGEFFMPFILPEHEKEYPRLIDALRRQMAKEGLKSLATTCFKGWGSTLNMAKEYGLSLLHEYEANGVIKLKTYDTTHFPEIEMEVITLTSDEVEELGKLMAEAMSERFATEVQPDFPTQVLYGYANDPLFRIQYMHDGEKIKVFSIVAFVDDIPHLKDIYYLKGDEKLGEAHFRYIIEEMAEEYDELFLDFRPQKHLEEKLMQQGVYLETKSGLYLLE